MDDGFDTRNRDSGGAEKKAWVKPEAKKADVAAITESNIIGTGADGFPGCSS